jgi:hypothetical protein
MQTEAAAFKGALAFGWSSKVPCKRLLPGCFRETQHQQQHQQGLIQILERDTAAAIGSEKRAWRSTTGCLDQTIRVSYGVWVAASTWVGGLVVLCCGLADKWK